MTHIYALVAGQLILYVGKTNDMKERLRFHKRKGDKTHSKYIPEYIDWSMKLLETVADDQAVIKEQYYYDTLKPLYNCRRPGQTKKEIHDKYVKTNIYKEKQKQWNNSDKGKEYKRLWYLNNLKKTTPPAPADSVALKISAPQAQAVP